MLKETVRLNTPIRLSNNISESTATTSKTTGMSSSLLQNSLIIMHQALPPAFHLSLLIRDTTRISQYTSCYGVSAFNGTSISDIQYFIGTIFVNVSLSSTL